MLSIQGIYPMLSSIYPRRSSNNSNKVSIKVSDCFLVKNGFAAMLVFSKLLARFSSYSLESFDDRKT